MAIKNELQNELLLSEAVAAVLEERLSGNVSEYTAIMARFLPPLVDSGLIFRCSVAGVGQERVWLSLQGLACAGGAHE